MASISGLENTFTKRDAADILVIDYEWKDVKNKPEGFDEAIVVINKMMAAASGFEYLTAADVLLTVKEVINEVLMNPLSEGGGAESAAEEDDEAPNTIVIAYDWNLILDKPTNVLKAIECIEALRKAASECSLLTAKSTFMETKEVVNAAVLKPLKGER